MTANLLTARNQPEWVNMRHPWRVHCTSYRHMRITLILSTVGNRALVRYDDLEACAECDEYSE